MPGCATQDRGRVLDHDVVVEVWSVQLEEPRWPVRRGGQLHGRCCVHKGFLQSCPMLGRGLSPSEVRKEARSKVPSRSVTAVGELEDTPSGGGYRGHGGSEGMSPNGLLQDDNTLKAE